MLDRVTYTQKIPVIKSNVRSGIRFAPAVKDAISGLSDGCAFMGGEHTAADQSEGGSLP
jgi:hypothetical protein